MSAQTHRIPNRLDRPLTSLLLSWEVLLLLVAIGVFIFNSFASPHFLDVWTLSDMTFNFTEKALLALPDICGFHVMLLHQLKWPMAMNLT